MSKHEIHDIATTIQYEPSFDHNSTQKQPFSIKKIQTESTRRNLYFYNIKTWFKAFWDVFSRICLRPWIRSLSHILLKRPLRTLILLKIQFCLPKRLLRDDFLTSEISKNMIPGIFPAFSPKPSKHPNYTELCKITEIFCKITNKYEIIENSSMNIFNKGDD